MNPFEVEELLELVLKNTVCPPLQAGNLLSVALVCRRWNAVLKPLVLIRLKEEYMLTTHLDAPDRPKSNYMLSLLQQQDGRIMPKTPQTQSKYPLLCALGRYLDGIGNACDLLVEADYQLGDVTNRKMSIILPRCLPTGSAELALLRASLKNSHIERVRLKWISPSLGGLLAKLINVRHDPMIALGDTLGWSNSSLKRVLCSLNPTKKDTSVMGAVERDVLDNFYLLTNGSWSKEEFDFGAIYKRTLWKSSRDMAVIRATVQSFAEALDVSVDRTLAKQRNRHRLIQRKHQVSERRRFESKQPKQRSSNERFGR
jgi:hypothetical protein